MTKFPDKRDLQLLELLAQDCRLSHAALSAALRLSKDAVAYRSRRLERSGYLKQHVLFVDARRLGFTRYHLLFRLGMGNRQAIAAALATHPAVMWVNTFIGRYDLQVIVDATDGFHLDRIRKELFAICKNRVAEYSILTHLFDLEFTHLNPTIDLGTKITTKNDASFSKTLLTRRFPVSPAFSQVAITPLENELLSLLADDPRTTLVDLAAALDIDRQTAKKHIERLIADGVLLNFGGVPDVSKFGYVTYYLLVRIAQGTPLDVLRAPFARLNNIFYAGSMVGDYDMILYLNARNPEELNTSISLFRKQLGQHIIHYDLLVQDKVQHWRQYTPGIHSTLAGRFRIEEK